MQTKPSWNIQGGYVACLLCQISRQFMEVVHTMWHKGIVWWGSLPWGVCLIGGSMLHSYTLLDAWLSQDASGWLSLVSPIPPSSPTISFIYLIFPPAIYKVWISRSMPQNLAWARISSHLCVSAPYHYILPLGIWSHSIVGYLMRNSHFLPVLQVKI